MSRRLTSSRWWSSLLAVGVLIAWAGFLFRQLQALQQFDWYLAPTLWMIALGFGAAYFIGLGCCWVLLLAQIEGCSRRFAFGSALHVWLSSMLTRYVPGNVWHIVARVALAGRIQVSRERVIATATAEQVLALISALAMGILCLPFGLDLDGLELWLVPVVVVGIVALHPRICGRVVSSAARRLRRPELEWQYSYKDMLAIIAAYCLCWICMGLSLFAVLSGFVPLDISTLPLVLGAAPVAWAFGYLSFLTPSGLGVREAALVGLLSVVVPLPVAIVASLVFRVVLTAAELLTLISTSIWSRCRRRVWLPHDRPRI